MQERGNGDESERGGGERMKGWGDGGKEGGGICMH